jgi:Na+/H+ antiporter NhaC
MKIVDGVQKLIFKSGAPDGLAKFNFNNSENDTTLTFKSGEAQFDFQTDKSGKLLLIKNYYKDEANDEKSKYRLFHFTQTGVNKFRIKEIPLWMSIIPPLVAIALALVFKEVIVSLFVGIWAGAFITNGLQFGTIIYSILEVVQKYVVGALNDVGHLSVIIFSLMIGGMVAIISRNGGMAGVVQALSKYAKSPRRAQFITWLLGIAIFFDDYANTLIVGNTMRSVTDKFKVSREKLAYIVDSTAAPVSAIAFVTTWIGAELGYIEGGILQLQNFDYNVSAYSIFISSLKYSFYPILTLIFILLIIYLKKDYGPMQKAELRAATTGQVSPARTSDEDEPNMEDLTPVRGAPFLWYNAALPVLVVILMTIFGLMSTGMESSHSSLVTNDLEVASSGWGDTWASLKYLSLSENDLAIFKSNDAALSNQKTQIIEQLNNVGFSQKLGIIIGSADSYVALLWASLLGIVIAMFLTISKKIMSLFETMHTMTTGFKTMMPALIILTLAWALAMVTNELYTANYLTSILQDNISPYAMPMLIFVLAAAIAFSTGSSWSTMAILYPIAIPTTWAICVAQGLDPDISFEILLNVIAVVLAASVMGDHCSPISDTTILSSLASDCNHIDHVRTQMPYALTVGLVSLIAGGLSTYLGGGWGISFLIILASIGIFTFIIKRFGKTVDDAQ